MQLRNILIVTAAILVTAAYSLLFFYPTPEIQTANAGGATPDVFNYLPMVIKPAEPTATPIPTIAPTATTPPANVQITLIVYNPAGDDVQGEYVRLENKGGVTAVMDGWTLSDDDGQVFTFPAFSLAAGASVQIWTKGGANNTSNLYWGRSWSVWTNTGDVAYLRSGGTLVDSCSYAGGGTQASC